MAEQNVVPDVLRGAITRLQKDIYELKRRALPALSATPPRQPPALRFTALGPATAGVESTREQFSGDGDRTATLVIVQVQLSLLANAIADHTIEIGVDGSPIQQFTLPSGQAMNATDAAIVGAATSYMTVKLITDIDSDLLIKLLLQSS